MISREGFFTRLLLTYLASCLGSILLGQAQPNQIQTIPLNSGWNLVSIQVAPDAGLTPAQVRASLVTAANSPVDALQAMWTLGDSASDWRSLQIGAPSDPADFGNVRPGRGYWIKVHPACFLSLTNAAWQGSVEIRPGWNLVGFPGLFPDASGSSLEAVFREKLSAIQQIWTWDGAPARQRYVGYDTSARPALKELSTIEPGKAYWIYSTSTASIALTNFPAIALPRDVDFPPLSADTPRIAGNEDADNDLNGNGLLDDEYDQDTLFFPVGVDSRLVTILNQGYGRLDWIATALPLSSSSFVSFATANPTVDASRISPDLITAQAGRLKFHGTNLLSGSVASEPGFLTVQAHRAGLVPGRHSDSFSVTAGSKTKTIRVIVDVPAIDGDWRGFASTRKVNGKETSIGKVDLQLAIFRRDGGANPNSQGIRGIINRSRSLLFPRDVEMSGSFFADHEFFLTTNFEVPRGDRNAPPFTKFKTGADDRNNNKGFGDYDANEDGKLDNANPFPFALRREISLIGTRQTENRLTGSYIESIQNILPGAQKIYIEGEFELERLTTVPTLTSVFNSSLSTNVIIGGGGSSSFTTGFDVTNPFTVKGIAGSFTMDFGGGKDVEVLLTPPRDGKPFTLFPKSNGVQGVQSFALTNFTETPANGRWGLTVLWGGGSERGNFTGWDLRLSGIATYEVTGTVRTVSGDVPNSLAAVPVLLTGNGEVVLTNTTSEGRFTFKERTENDYTIIISVPGFEERRVDFDLFSTSRDLGTILLTPLTTNTSALLLAPGVGAEPLNVLLTPLLSTSDASALGSITSVSWDFGNNATFTVTTNRPSPISFVYTSAGYFTAIATQGRRI